MREKKKTNIAAVTIRPFFYSDTTMARKESKLHGNITTREGATRGAYYQVRIFYSGLFRRVGRLQIVAEA